MQKVNLKQLQGLLPSYYETKLPLYLWGKPSTGKTAIIRQFAMAKAEELGLKYSEDEFGAEYFTLKVIPLSQFDAPDLRGMPELIGEGVNRRTSFVPSKELPRCGQGIIFFDEMNCADDTVRSAAYQFIQEGRYSNVPVVIDAEVVVDDIDIGTAKERKRDAFWRVAASNTEQDFSAVNTLQLALLKRFCHYQVEPEIDEVINYMLEHGCDARIIGYLKNFQDDLFPKVWDERLLDHKANPFPYTWELGSILITDKDKPQEITNLVAGCVGSEVAARFAAYCKVTSKIDLEAIIKEPEILRGLEKDKDRASLYYAVISNLASMWFRSDKKLSGDKVVTISSVLPVEFAVSFLNMVCKKRLTVLAKVKEFNALLTKLGMFFDDI
jgi:hypothetical protein